ncbi:hypothetical protein [Methyloceanibacter sp.]|uniref:hypothetical protein n=1 Tax=Methyloceanibacter sp. TaxID=1965321 RepID=UPI002CB66764|nr:hypothetical protein [Methyloceanibacter sp.]HML93414.1 hypothetical protein [Methyloceanibacter sp.]
MTKKPDYSFVTYDDTGAQFTRGKNARTGKPSVTARTTRGVNPRGNPNFGTHDWTNGLYALVARIGREGFPTGADATERLREQVENAFEDIGHDAPCETESRRAAKAILEYYESYVRLFGDE